MKKRYSAFWVEQGQSSSDGARQLLVALAEGIPVAVAARQAGLSLRRIALLLLDDPGFRRRYEAACAAGADVRWRRVVDQAAREAGVRLELV